MRRRFHNVRAHPWPMVLAEDFAAPGRDLPIQNEAARAAVLVSLATVDLVVIFNQDTPIRLIEAIRPDVLVKGADYTIDQVVGAEFVESYGGSVLLAEISRGHSTTETITKLAGRKAAPD